MSLREHASPLRVANFRYFFVGEVVNTAGSSMSGIALAFAVLRIDDSATALGPVVAASTVPMVAFMLIGGALADRLPRALVLRGCNLGPGASSRAIVATLVLTDLAEIWHLVGLSFITGTVFAVSYPAFHGMVPILLPPEERKSGFLLIDQSDALLRIGGPVLSGIPVATVGAGWALAIDAATYVVAAAFLGLVRLPFGERPERRTSVIGDFVVGWAFARQLGWVIPASCCALVFNALISGSIYVLGPVIADDTIGSRGWGLAVSGRAVGLFVGTPVLVKITIRRPMWVIMIGFAVMSTPMLLLGTRVNTAALAVAFFIAGAAVSAPGLAWNLTVQEKVPEQMLSRIMAIDGFFSFVAMPIGQVLVGPFSAQFGIRAVELGSVALCVPVMVVALSVPAIRDLRLVGPQPGSPGQDSTDVEEPERAGDVT
ncbi:MFS transporter [Nocardioides sp. B-3]|uniref:MFS transporter n=1 Tax=Nocardioides sp. B-3 TaxID=2895565 RepID=UPI0021526C43|nr:MFS transporter [Nocardioides sp. B-3]UUZ59819.1 MFS transporter [Nocardioides sp. B-3]